jgi:tRNA threonylcarbamoyladenosine biosynthesis protein TsaB
MRSLTIALDGSTYFGSVALIRDNEVIAERTLGGDEGGVQRSGRGEKLMPALAECLAEAEVSRDAIARIVCGAGPGSFTSLRVAGSVAKGLAVGYGVELFAVSSLLLIVAGARQPLASGEYLAVLDAMRGEFYAAPIVVAKSGEARQSGDVSLLTVDELSAIGRRGERRVAGPAQHIDLLPHARGIAKLLPAILQDGPADLASWEPDYGRLAEAQVRWEAEHGRPLPR